MLAFASIKICNKKEKGKIMQKKEPVKIRVSESLYEKIDMAAQKSGKSKSRYIREQLYITPKINQENFKQIKKIVNEEIKQLGIKINSRAHLYNTYGADNDKDIYLTLSLVLEKEVMILKLLDNFYEKENRVVVFETEQKRKTLTTWLTKNERTAIQRVQQEDNEKNISVYIRKRLENESEYSPSSIPPTLNMFNNQIYHILSNLKQISYQYEKSNIDNRKLKYLNEKIFKLKIIIVSRMEKYYGNYKATTHQREEEGK